MQATLAQNPAKNRWAWPNTENKTYSSASKFHRKRQRHFSLDGSRAKQEVRLVEGDESRSEGGRRGGLHQHPHHGLLNSDAGLPPRPGKDVRLRGSLKS